MDSHCAPNLAELKQVSVHFFLLLSLLLSECSLVATTAVRMTATSVATSERECKNPLFNATVTKSQANSVIGEMLIKFGIEPDFASNAFQCIYYFSHIDLYMQARYEIHPADFSEVREANAEFFECLSTLSHQSNGVFNEVARNSRNKVEKAVRMSTPLNPTLVSLCGMKEGQWKFPKNFFGAPEITIISPTAA